MLNDTLYTCASTPNQALRRTVDQSGRIVRENEGTTLTLSQTSTKEIKSGVRTLVRIDVAAAGEIPAASAYVVVVSADTPSGRDSASNALLQLMSALVMNAAGSSNTSDGYTFGVAAPANSSITLSQDSEEANVTVFWTSIKTFWGRILRGEL